MSEFFQHEAICKRIKGRQSERAVLREDIKGRKDKKLERWNKKEHKENV